MISLTCANCQATLDVDDAFAGGVCRCQHCGTIQTVPRAGASQKTLYKQKVRPESIASGAGTGLDDLANIVTSSGLNSGRLRRPREEPSKKKLGLLLGIAGVVIVLLLILLLIPSNKKSDAPAAAAQQGTSTPTTPVKAVEPNFLNVPITENTVIYVLDRGDSSREIFDPLKNATFASIATLGPNRRFQIIFWNNGEDFSFPLGQPIAASPENLSAAKKSLEDVIAFGKTTAKPAIEKSTLNNAQVVLLVTAKAWGLEDSFADEVLLARSTGKYKIHTFAIGDAGTGTSLKTIADKTGGQYHVLDKAGLKELSGS